MRSPTTKATAITGRRLLPHPAKVRDDDTVTARTKTFEDTPARRALLASLEIDPVAMATRWEPLSDHARTVLEEWERSGALRAALDAVGDADPDLRP